MKTTLLACLALALVLVYVAEYAEAYQVYVHWGQRGCPINKFVDHKVADGINKRSSHFQTAPPIGTLAKVIYNGYVAKSQWKGKGAGSEFICLPEEPEWALYKDEMQSVLPNWLNSQIYGTQFVEYNISPQLGSDIGDYHLADVPCTLCETVVAAHHETMMMPARLNCPPTWTRQYKGYLMAEPSKNKKSQSNYICVDGYRGFDKNGNQNPHARLAMVEVGCRDDGLLPCGAYPHGRELTCVVCVK